MEWKSHRLQAGDVKDPEFVFCLQIPYKAALTFYIRGQMLREGGLAFLSEVLALSVGFLLGVLAALFLGAT